jgi:rhodanese-related sulfurtransferase
MLLRVLLLTLCTTLYAQAQAQEQEAPEQVKGAMTVSVDQARRLYDLGAVFIDVRPDREWAWGHVHGAVHLDLQDHFAGLAQRQWPRDVPLVIYCDSEVCPRSALAASLAVQWGYKQVFYFREGFFAWQLYDQPIGKGIGGEVVAAVP